MIATTSITSACLSGAQWFSDFGLIVSVAAACMLLSLISFRESQNKLFSTTENEVLRVKAIFLTILALSMLSSLVQPFGILSLVIVFTCNGFLYIQERRFGSICERQVATTV